MEEQVLPHFTVPKMVPYSRLGDLKTHLKTFKTQMLISWGFDVVCCKMFVGTLTRTALQWFKRTSYGTVNSFQTFSQLFLQQFAANQVKPPKLVDLFDIRQKEREPLRTFLNQFYETTVKIDHSNEEMFL